MPSVNSTYLSGLLGMNFSVDKGHHLIKIQRPRVICGQSYKFSTIINCNAK